MTFTDIPERKSAEEALHQAEAKYQSFFDNAVEGMFQSTPGGQYLSVNPALAHMYGYDSPEELVGAIISIQRQVYVDLHKRTEFIRRLEADGVVRGFEAQVYRKDGSTIWISEHARAVRDERGRVLYYEGTVEDITTRKRAEETLTLYQEIFANSTDAIAIMDPQGSYLEQNPAHAQLLGVPIGELRGKTPAIHLGDDVFEAIAKELAHSGRYRGEHTARARGGNLLHVEFSAFAVRDPTGAPHCYVGIMREITERKEAEDALRDSEARFKAFMDNSPTVAFIKDEDGRYLYVNKLWERRFQKSVPEWLGKTDFDLWPGENVHEIRERDQAVLEEGRALETTRVLAVPGEGPRTWWVFKFPIAGSGGRRFVGGIAVDITKRKLAEEQLAKSHEQLRELAAHLESVREEERTRIAREIHDELGLALTVLKMDLAWTGRRLSLEDFAALRPRLVEKIQAMAKLVDGTVQVVQKIATALRPGVLDELGLPAAIEWQTQEFQTRTGIQCHLAMTPESFAMDRAQSTALFRIFQEILTNVARHAQASRVSISLEETADQVILEVRDNGRGITRDQVTSPKSLGLVGMRERAMQWGGDVTLRGLRQNGTTVTVRIPLGARAQRG